MKYLSLFSGIEAASVAIEGFGTPVAFSEIEPFPCATLEHWYPEVPNLGDATKITEEQIKALGPIDLVVFGFPCTDLSVAGKRAGLRDEDGNVTRSGLFFDAIRVIGYAREHCGCRFALLENVPGAFSSNKGADFTEVVKLMAGCEELDTPANGWGTEGVALGTQLVEYAVLDAQWFGLAQRRKRVFALADFGDWTSRPPILLEPESLRGDTPPSRETRESFTHATAPCLTSSGMGVERTGDTRGQDPVVGSAVGGLDLGTYSCDGIGAYSSSSITAPLLKTGMDLGNGCECLVAHTLCGEGFDASEDGTGRGTPLVPVASETFILQHAQIGRKDSAGPQGKGWQKDVAFTMDSRPSADVVAFSAGNSSGSRGIGYSEEHTPPLRAGASGTNQVQTIAFHIDAQPDEMNFSADTTATLTKSQHAGVCELAPQEPLRIPIRLPLYGINPVTEAVQYGLPKDFYEERAYHGSGRFYGVAEKYRTTAFSEAETLMYKAKLIGDKDGAKQYHKATYSEIPNILRNVRPPNFQVRRLLPSECAILQGFSPTYLDIQFRNKPAADGNKYKALGNSFAVPVVAWIGRRIKAALDSYVPFEDLI